MAARKQDYLWAALTLGLALETAVHSGWEMPADVVWAIVLHLITAVLFLIRSPASQVDKSVWSVTAMPVSLSYVYLYRFSEPVSFAQPAADVLLFAGMALCLAATVTLGRRFGVLPANRGVETRGPYRFVRHPVYASYLLMDLGIVCIEPSGRNIALATAGWIAHSIRIWREETVLRGSPEYVSYAARVQYRLIPRII